MTLFGGAHGASELRCIMITRNIFKLGPDPDPTPAKDAPALSTKADARGEARRLAKRTKCPWRIYRLASAGEGHPFQWHLYAVVDPSGYIDTTRAKVLGIL